MTDKNTDVSPTPKKKKEVKGMSFYEALKRMLEGERITRPSWAQDEWSFIGKDEMLYVHRNGKDHEWMLHRIDMEANDYTVALLN